MLLLLLARAQAATLVVDTSGAAGTYSTISAAVSAANSGDRIEVDTGAWYECVTLNKSVTLVGTGGSSVTEIGGGGYCTDAITVTGANVSIEGFTVSNPGEQAILASGATLSLVDVILDGAGASSVAVGGALEFTGSSLSVEQATFSANEAAACGAVSLDDGVVATFTDVVFDTNHAGTGRGGALCLGANAEVSLSGAEFSDNDAEGAGAALLAAGSTLQGTDTEWKNNHANDEDDEGGAILVLANATLNLQDAVFRGNGSGASNSGMNGDSISAMEAGASVTITDATFDAPDTYGAAGQIYLEEASEATITRGSFSDSYTDIWSYGTGSLVTTIDCDSSRAYNYSVVVWGTYTDVGSEFSNTETGVSLRGEGTLSGSWFHDLTDEAVVVPEGAISLSDVLVEDAGGVVVEEATGTITVTGSRFVNTSSSDGGAVGVEYGDLEVVDSTAEGCAASRGGAFFSTYGDLSLDGVTVTDCRATTGGAAGVGGYTGLGQRLTVVDSWFEGNEATSGGGALYAPGEYTDIADSVFVGNFTGSSGRGGAVSVGELGVATVSGSVFCGNEAYAGGAIAGYLNESLSVANSVFAENVATDEGGATWVYGGAGTFVNSTFVGNEAPSSGGGLHFHEATGSITNSIVAYTVAGDGLYGDSNSGDDVVVTYTDWFGNSSVDRSGGFVFPTTGFGNTTNDPGFIAANIDGNCWNDNWKLHPTSALVDAGDPSLKDADGSASDLGATGGAAARWADDDGDDWLAPWDCDDGDSTVNGGATETAYDGVDDDCDGADLTDVDGDGYDALVVGGDDCADDDATRHPGARETKDDGIDQDCDGEDSVTPQEDTGGDTSEDTGVPVDSGDSADSAPPDTADSAVEAEDSDPEDTAAAAAPGCGEPAAEGGCASALGAWAALGGVAAAVRSRRRSLTSR